MQRSCKNFEPMILRQINFRFPTWSWFADPPTINGTWNWVISEMSDPPHQFSRPPAPIVNDLSLTLWRVVWQFNHLQGQIEKGFHDKKCTLQVNKCENKYVQTSWLSPKQLLKLVKFMVNYHYYAKKCAQTLLPIIKYMIKLMQHFPQFHLL